MAPHKQRQLVSSLSLITARFAAQMMCRARKMILPLNGINTTSVESAMVSSSVPSSVRDTEEDLHVTEYVLEQMIFG